MLWLKLLTKPRADDAFAVIALIWPIKFNLKSTSTPGRIFLFIDYLNRVTLMMFDPCLFEIDITAHFSRLRCRLFSVHQIFNLLMKCCSLIIGIMRWIDDWLFWHLSTISSFKIESNFVQWIVQRFRKIIEIFSKIIQNF